MSRTVPHLGVLIIVTMVAAVHGQQCNITSAWFGEWLDEYERNTGGYTGVLYYDTFNQTMRAQSKGSVVTYSTCEAASTDKKELVTYETVIAFKRTDNQRYCFSGIERGHIILYQETNPQSRSNAFSVPECSSIFSNPSAFNAMMKLSAGQVFSFPMIQHDLPRGTYIFTYVNGNDLEQCKGAGSTMTITNDKISILSCHSGASSYVKPLNVNLKIVTTVTDEELRIDGTSVVGGIVVLAYETTDVAQKYVFYIARYSVERNSNRMQMLFTTESPQKPTGYLAKRFISPSVPLENVLTFFAESQECKAPKVCENGGTCIQRWRDFRCTCAPGFSGKNCSDDTNECLSKTNPCNMHGKCVDKINKFVCECDPGWGGDFCERQDLCNPNPCKGGATCVERLNTAMCECPPLYIGPNCGVFDYCGENPNLCQNGGSCFLGGPDGFRCACAMGQTGKYCEVPITTGPGGTGPGTNAPRVCSAAPDLNCQNGGVCKEGRCQCTTFWTGAKCQDIAQWFITSLALISLLVLLLIIILIACCCCCYGPNNGSSSGGNNDMTYQTMEKRSMSGTGPIPASVQFNMVRPPSASYGNVLTSSR